MTWQPGFRPDDDCIEWEWRRVKGYGIVGRGMRSGQLAHRVAAHAKPGDVVLHMCDNPGCVNPNHLRIGTHEENNWDRVTKARRHKEIMRWANAVYAEIYGGKK